MTPVIAAIVLTIFVTGFGALLVFLSSILGPKVKQSKVLQSAYECGLPVNDSDQSKIPVKFYLTAILFILFDIEIIFLFPWAIAYSEFLNNGMGWFIFSVMAVFLGIFALGLFWEVKSNALEWE